MWLQTIYFQFQGQSGIYYDVEYEPSGLDLYNSNNTNSNNNLMQSSQGIPLSTYSTGRAPSSYYK